MLLNPVNTRVGAQIIGPRYKFTDDPVLVEAARGMLEMGSDVIKFVLRPSAYFDMGREHVTASECIDKYDAFRRVLDMPFKTYMMWVHPTFTDSARQMDFEMSEEVEGKIYDEIYAFAVKLLREYNNSGKIFMIGNWEGDWILLQGFDFWKDGDPAVAEGLKRNFAVRQKAIEDARRDVAHENVYVAHYIEVNRPLDAKHGLLRLVNGVLPYVRTDIVSYSAYDALWPHRVTEALSYIEENAVFTDYFDGVFEKKVFVGEYDAYVNYHVMGYQTPQQQRDQAWLVMCSAIAWGAPYVVFWEYYNNEYERMKNNDGFWLVDYHNTKMPAYYLHQDIAARLQISDQLCRAFYDRPMTMQETALFVNQLERYKTREILSFLLDNHYYDHEDKAAFALKLAQWLPGSKPSVMDTREAMLRAAFNDPGFAEKVPLDRFRHALKLDMAVTDPSFDRYDLWRYAIDHHEFQLDALRNRFGDTVEKAIDRWFPFA